MSGMHGQAQSNGLRGKVPLHDRRRTLELWALLRRLSVSRSTWRLRASLVAGAALWGLACRFRGGHALEDVWGVWWLVFAARRVARF